jgi:leucyl aminopeptidase
MSNNSSLVEKILSSAGETDEYMWQLPIIEPFRKDMKSNIADLKNMGGSRFGGASKAAAFLENFVDPSIPWAHLDIAGIGDSQSHLPYCPSKGASGSIVRTLTHFLINQ